MSRLFITNARLFTAVDETAAAVAGATNASSDSGSPLSEFWVSLTGLHS